MYSPVLARFISKDPKGYIDGMNLYAYVKNNPLKYLDAFGTTAHMRFEDDFGSGILSYSISGRTNDYNITYDDYTGFGYYSDMKYKQYDSSGNTSIFLHGTFSSPADAEPDFIDSIGKTYGGRVYQFDWSGKDGLANGEKAENRVFSRSNAAWRLTQTMEDYNFKENSTFNIVGHSHGGNVIKDFTQYYEGEKKINNAIFLATPNRVDHTINYNNFEKTALIKNVYDSSDIVQKLGGNWSEIQFFGFAKRTIENSGVNNIQVEVLPNRNFYDELFRDHSNMDSKYIWEKIND